MKIMNVANTNCASQKQNQPEFGMKLDFTPEAKKMIIGGAFEKISQQVADIKTIYGEDILVKGKLNSKHDKSIKLSAQVGNRSVNNIIVSHEVNKSTFELQHLDKGLFSLSVLSALKIMKQILDA